MKKNLIIFTLAFSLGIFPSCSNNDDESRNTNEPEIVVESPLDVVAEGKTWTLRIKPSVSPDYSLVKIEENMLKGKEMIDGIPYLRMYSRSCTEGEAMPQEWKATNEYYKEDAGKIYLCEKKTTGNTIIKLLDFSLKVGDIFQYPVDEGLVPWPFKVVAVSDTILDSSTDKTLRKCIYLEPEFIPGEKRVWIEGIGSECYGISGYMYYRDKAHVLRKCTNDEDILYKYE